MKAPTAMHKRHVCLRSGRKGEAAGELTTAHGGRASEHGSHDEHALCCCVALLC